MLTELRSEKFEWFCPSPIEPFNLEAFSAPPRPANAGGRDPATAEETVSPFPKKGIKEAGREIIFVQRALHAARAGSASPRRQERPRPSNTVL